MRAIGSRRASGHPQTPWALIGHTLWPRNVQPLRETHARGFAARREEGELMELSLQVSDADRIEAVRCRAVGSGITVACGSVFSELIRGRTLADALRVTPEDVARALDGLPAHYHAETTLPVVALRSALEDRRRRSDGLPSSAQGCLVHQSLPEQRRPLQA